MGKSRKVTAGKGKKQAWKGSGEREERQSEGKGGKGKREESEEMGKDREGKGRTGIIKGRKSGKEREKVVSKGRQ